MESISDNFMQRSMVIKNGSVHVLIPQLAMSLVEAWIQWCVIGIVKLSNAIISQVIRSAFHNEAGVSAKLWEPKELA